MGTNTWQGSNDDWTANPAADWSEGTLPSTTDDVVIPNGDPQITTNVGTVKSVTVDDNLNLKNGGSLTTSGDFKTTGSDVGVDQVTNQGGSSLAVDGALTVGSSAEFLVGNAKLSADDSVTAGTLSLGAASFVSLTGDSAGAHHATMTISDAAPGVLIGAISVSNDAQLDFKSGSIMTIAEGAGVTLVGSQAQINDTGATGVDTALAGLQTNNGGVSLDGGASLTTNGDFTNNNSVMVGGSGAGGGSSLTVKGTFSNASTGLVDVGAAGVTEAGNSLTTTSLDNAGTISLQETKSGSLASLIVNGATTGAGSIGLAGNAIAEFGAGSDNNVSLSPGTLDNTVKLDNPADAFSGNISGFAAGDTLDLANEKVTIQSYDGSTLVVKTAGNTTQSFALSGPAANGLQTVDDGQNGTDVVVVCFRAGTLIGTDRGGVAVEHLAIGDLVATASGALRPIRWLGHRKIDCRAHPDKQAAWPIRIACDAFGKSQPTRDLYLSPGHSICVDILGEVLVPAGLLVNGTTITQVEVEAVSYWHVELDEHDIILAEGLATESYLEMGNRGFFREADVVALDARPDAAVVTPPGFCRPYVSAGALLEAARARLRAQAARGEGRSVPSARAVR